MAEAITPKQFHEADDVQDWRVPTNVAHAHFRNAVQIEGDAGEGLAKLKDEDGPGCRFTAART